MYKKLSLAIVVILMCLTPIAADDWISFGHDYTHNAFVTEESDFVTNLWTFNFGSPIFSSPAISNEYLYLSSSNGQLKSIDMEDGTENWNLDLKSGTNATPIVRNGTLYIGSEDSFSAIDVDSHKVIWEYSTSAPISSSAYIYEDVVYVGCDDGHLYGFDNDTGDVKFDVDLDGKLKSSPVAVNDTVYIGSSNGKLYAVGVDSKKVDWEYTTGDSIYSSPAYGDEKIFVGSTDGNLYAINESNGSLVWKADLNNKVLSSPTIDEHDNNVFIGSDEGNLTCLDIRDGTLKWSHSVGSPIQSTPALKDKMVAVTSNGGSAYVLNKYTGLEEFSYNPGTILFNSPITSSPVINGNSLFISGNDGYLYSLNIDKHEVPASVFLYYAIAVLCIVLVVVIVVIKKFRK